MTSVRAASRGILGDILKYIPGQIVPAIIGFIAVPVYVRLLGPTEYGVYSLAVTTMLLGSSVAFNWLHQSALRFFEIHQSQKSLDSFGATLLVAFGVEFVVLMVGVSLFVSLFLRVKQLDVGVVYLTLAAVGTQAGYMLVQSAIRGERRAGLYSVYALFSNVMKILATVSFVLVLGRQAKAALFGEVVAFGCVFLWELRQLMKRWNIDVQTFSLPLAWNFAVYGIPLSILSASEWALAMSDRYMLGYFLGVKAVGIYSAVYTLVARMMRLFYMPLVLAAFPVLIHGFERWGNRKQTSSLFSNIIELYFLAITPLLVYTIMLSRDITKIILGDSFVQASALVPWISGGTFFLGATFCFNQLIMLEKRTLLLIVVASLAAILNFAFNAMFIPVLGITAPAIGTFVSYLAQLMLTALLAKRLLTWSVEWYTIANALIAAIFMCLGIGLANYLMRLVPAGIMAMLVKGGFGTGVYIVALFLFMRERIFELTTHLANSTNDPNSLEA